MNTKYIQEYVHLAKVLSFGKTAQELNISEAALSRHVGMLEEELGVSLFDRDTRNVKLSPYGEIFLEYAERFLHVQMKYTREIERLRKNESEMINIYHVCFLSDLIGKFQQSHPEIKLNSIRATNGYHYQLDVVKKGKAEILFLEEVEDLPEDYVCEPFRSYEYVVALPNDDPLAQQETVAFEQLRNRKFAMILHEWTDGFDIQKKIKATYNINPKVAFYFNGVAPLVSCVSNERCVGLLKKDKLLEAHAQSVAIRRLEPQISRMIYMCYSRDVLHNSAARDFIQFIRTQIGETV